ncbi:pentapeptide repeat-containing protein [Lentzea roselyniae]|uniref:Pentapeptide repeat-containing protein n=2 Tax=Lentzea roselyniae TaxID=531940 RepID=A0ABP7BXD8_9PSEU
MASPVPQPTSREPLQPMPRKVIALVATGIALVTIVLVVVLWWWGTAGLSGKELVTARLDALRTGLSIGIGGGGVFALYLAWRRQHATEVGLVQKELDQADVARAYELQREVAEHNRLHAERVAAATEKDAADRRVTELYTKASEQLGSDKAPVRFAGIYALERLAQDNPEHRQTIVNLLCAYLRMPYPPPGDENDADHRERVQELEVRRTAQHVLSSHLRPAAGVTFWGEAQEVNLNGATLVDVDFSGCHFGEADFGEAVFVGTANFVGAAFTRLASFNRVVFEGFAQFVDVKFDAVFFVNATFHGTNFMNAAFRLAQFDGARFRAAVRAEVAEVHHPRHGGSDRPGDYFNTAHFRELGNFRRASFDAGVDFSDVTGSGLEFGGACFGGVTKFNRTTILAECLVDDGAGQFIHAQVSTGDVATRSTWPENWVVGEDGVITERPVETSASD